MKTFYQTSVTIPDVPANVRVAVGDVWTFPDVPLLRRFKIHTTSRSYSFTVAVSGVNLLICVQKMPSSKGTVVDLLGTDTGDYDLGAYLQAFQRARWRSDVDTDDSDATPISLLQADASDLYIRYITSTSLRLCTVDEIEVPYMRNGNEALDSFYLRLFFLDSGRPVFENEGSQSPLLLRERGVTFAVWRPSVNQRYDFALRALSWVGARGGRLPASQRLLVIGPSYTWDPSDTRDWSIVAALFLLGVRNSLVSDEEVRARLAVYAPNLTNLTPVRKSNEGEFPRIPWFVSFRDDVTTAASARFDTNGAGQAEVFEIGSLKVPIIVAAASVAMFILVRSGVMHTLAKKISELPLPEGLKKALINFSLSDSWAHRLNKQAVIEIDGVMREAKVFAALISKEKVLYWGNTPYEVLDYDVEGNAFVVELASLGVMFVQKISICRTGAVYHVRSLAARSLRLDNYQKERLSYDHT